MFSACLRYHSILLFKIPSDFQTIYLTMKKKESWIFERFSSQSKEQESTWIDQLLCSQR